MGFDRVLIGVHGDLVRVIFFLTLSFLISDFVSPFSLSLSRSCLPLFFSLCWRLSIYTSKKQRSWVLVRTVSLIRGDGKGTIYRGGSGGGIG